MTFLIVVLSAFVWVSAARAEQTLREISWPALQAEGRVAAGIVRPPDAGAAFPRLRFEQAQDAPTRVTILTLDTPGITGFPYGIAGSVRYEGVRGQGYLEMWSAFPDGRRYFSRTLGTGPLQPLQGTADWRPFVLPFFAEPGTPPPVALTLGVVLPARGTVELGPLRLVQYRPGEDPLAAPGQWWSERTGGLIGGLLGTVIGTLGAVIGWLASRGKARALVLGLMQALAGLGVVALVTGIVAALQGQPWAVHYPLILVGVVASLVFGPLLRPTRRRYDELELRKLRAADVR